MTITVLALLAVLATPPAPAAKVEACSTRLKGAEAARDLAQVKLEEETERADAQAYLIRLELRVTQQKLATALSKCGPACAPTATASPR